MDINPITPICNIAILRNIPLDNSYTDTLSFGSAASQATWFASKAKYSWQNLTPIRMQNRIRIPVKADDVYDCNYLMFQNTNFAQKWFYAFITEIRYVNPSVCEVGFELDVMQTWYFDYTLKACHVLREHVNSDEVGEHVLPEPVSLGDYVLEQGSKDGGLVDLRAVIQYAKDSAVGDGMTGGLFSGLTYMSAPLTAAGGGAMLDLLQSLIGNNRQDSVVASYIMPDAFYTTESEPVKKNITVPKSASSLGDYTPRNNKLLTYPYNMLMVDNLSGTQHMYRYEWFYNLSSSCIFEESCGMGVNPEVLLSPRSYNNQQINYSEAITLSGWPQFAYVIDTYRAWASKNQYTNLGNLVNFALGAAMPLAFPPAATKTRSAESIIGSTVAGEVSGIASMANLLDKANMPNVANAEQANNTLTAIGEKTFYFFQRHVQEEYAKAIDDFFDRYGYMVDCVKVPNRTGRPAWNYVKTDGCAATGSVPFGDMAKIKNIYNAGVTFWHSKDVGDYSQNNQI